MMPNTNITLLTAIYHYLNVLILYPELQAGLPTEKALQILLKLVAVASKSPVRDLIP